MKIMEELKELCTLGGISGDEGDIREYIISRINGSCEYETDNLGNLIVHKKGRRPTSKKLMLAAHMDEVGMIITSYKNDATLGFSAVGGVDAGVVAGRNVLVGKEKIHGVIGSPAIHNLTAEERKQPHKISNLRIDIGASDCEEAKRYVSLGDSVIFDSEFTELGSDYCKCRAIDDRAGCAILLDIALSEVEFDLTLVFTVQEEVGARGAKAAAFSVNPDYALVLETTTAADIPGVSGEKRVCILGNGAVVGFMDRSTIYDKELFNLAFDIANEKDIKIQAKTMIAGGNDSGAIHTSRGGVKTLAISVPVRYLHSPSCVMKYSDFIACRELCLAAAERILENA